MWTTAQNSSRPSLFERPGSLCGCVLQDLDLRLYIGYRGTNAMIGARIRYCCYVARDSTGRLLLLYAGARRT